MPALAAVGGLSPPLPAFVEGRFLGPAANTRRSLRHFNDYRGPLRRCSMRTSTPSSVHLDYSGVGFGGAQ
jgi:hypothetical protein